MVLVSIYSILIVECIVKFAMSCRHISTIRERFNKTALKSHNANANRNRKIKMIQTITLKQESQPSSSSSKILPIPLNIQPKIPPPVNTNPIIARIPIIANISILIYIICYLLFLRIVALITNSVVELRHCKYSSVLIFLCNIFD